ncbi:MAG: hypothetical protein Q8S73_20310 [Deltaproteobacteria bacterium]|nr:hypothetical protein [Myxococcales bacterium]MDP3216463.1 hypothetical protein [Deltaproteobacteria bacterium]
MRALVLVDMENGNIPDGAREPDFLAALLASEGVHGGTIVLAVSVHWPGLGGWDLAHAFPFPRNFAVELHVVPSGPEAADLALERALTRAASGDGAGGHDRVYVISGDAHVRDIVKEAPELSTWGLTNFIRHTCVVRDRDGAPELTRRIHGAAAGRPSIGGPFPALLQRLGDDPCALLEVAPSTRESWPPSRWPGLASSPPVPAAPAAPSRRALPGPATGGVLGPGTIECSGEILWSRVPAAVLNGPVPADGWSVDDQQVLSGCWTDTQDTSLTVDPTAKVSIDRPHLAEPRVWWVAPFGSVPRLLGRAWVKSKARCSRGQTRARATLHAGEMVFRSRVYGPTPLTSSGLAVAAGAQFPRIQQCGDHLVLLATSGDANATDWLPIHDVADVNAFLVQSGLDPDVWSDLLRLPLLVSESLTRSVPTPSAAVLAALQSAVQ